MTNPYYNPTGAPAQGSAVTSAVVRTEFAAIQAGFDKMPVLAGNAYEVLRVKGDESGFEASGLVVDSGGLLWQGDTTTVAGVTPFGAVLSTNTGTGASLVLRKSATGSYSSNLAFVRSRGTNAAPTTLVDGDLISNTVSYGFDGTNYVVSAGLSTYVFGTVSSGVVPGCFSFSTAGSSGSYTEKLRITADGQVTLGGTSAAPALKVNAYTAGNWVTISSGTNPTIGTSAGALAISASAYLATGSTYYATVVGGSVDGPLYSSSSGSVYVGGTLANPETKFIFSGGATRYLTFTGSIAGNPTIGTSAGNLAITPAIVASSTITSVDYMKCMSTTAIPAGGTAGVGYNFSNAANFGIFFGSGTPGLSAAKGSIYLRSDGSTTNDRMYVNTNGGTTWTAVTTVA